ncbi:MAG: caspase family protein [Chloroflexota bacterium]
MYLFTSGHALVIGVGSDLPNTVIDAKGIAEILTDPERCAYPAEQVNILTQEEASRAHLLSALDQLAEKVDSESTVIIYFSGHGYEVNTGIGSLYFLMPYGYDISKLPSTAINETELTAKLAAIKAKKMLVLFDCCHAGGFGDTIVQEKSPVIQFTKAPIPQEAADALVQGSGRVIISSCRREEKSYTGDPYSQFTQALAEAFSGKGTSRLDGFVKAADLAMYTAKTVPHHTNNKQNPILNFKDADNFIVAYYAGGESKPKGLPVSAQRKPYDVEAENRESPTGFSITHSGSGGTAVGDHNKVGGQGSIIADTIHGGVMTGENARKISTDTYIERQDIDKGQTFNQSGQRVNKQINIDGDITADQGFVNLGEIKNEQSSTTPIDNLQKVLTQIIVAAAQLPAEESSEAVKKANVLKLELIDVSQPDDQKVARLIQALAGFLPNETELFCTIYEEPAFRERTGEFTNFVLDGIVRM